MWLCVDVFIILGYNVYLWKIKNNRNKMKIAISGKGGVGKSSIAAAMALLLARDNKKVLALDVDPDANLANCLGVPLEIKSKIVPIAKHKELVEERTGAKINQYGQLFKLNPEVSDISDNFAVKHNGVNLLVTGAVDRGGGGCACPENVLVRALVTDLVLYKDDVLIMDMEAGIEHLGRATTRGIDCMIIVVEPGQNSIDCAERIIKMCGEIKLKNIAVVANKITTEEDETFIKKALPECKFLGSIPWSNEIRASDRNDKSVLENLSPEIIKKFENILDKLEF